MIVVYFQCSFPLFAAEAHQSRFQEAIEQHITKREQKTVQGRPQRGPEEISRILGLPLGKAQRRGSTARALGKTTFFYEKHGFRSRGVQKSKISKTMPLWSIENPLFIACNLLAM